MTPKKTTHRMRHPQDLPQMGVDVTSINRSVGPKRERSHHIVTRVESLSKVFKTPGGMVVIALNDVTMHLYAGEFVIIYGPSGCGKSTLLHTMLGLEQPTSGVITVRDQPLYELDSETRAHVRRHLFGMVFQQSHWIRSFNVWENVGYPLLLMGYSHADTKAHAVAILERLNIGYMANHSPVDLSGGQQQKVALARALVTNPRIIIADEPTGNLDSESGKEIMQLLVKLNREEGRTIVLVTHDLTLLSLGTRKIGLKDGKVVVDAYDTQK